QHALLDPVLSQIEGKFAYRGPAREYFLRAIHEQVEFTRGHNRLHYLGRYFAWQGYLGRRGRADRERREHAPLRELCREQRRARIDRIARIAELAPDHPVLAAIIEIPRERFVPTDQISESVADIAIALDDSDAATISAMHAYARSFSLLAIEPGDRVLDLGAGTGYGAARLATLVGERGRGCGRSSSIRRWSSSAAATSRSSGSRSSSPAPTLASRAAGAAIRETSPRSPSASRWSSCRARGSQRSRRGRSSSRRCASRAS